MIPNYNALKIANLVSINQNPDTGVIFINKKQFDTDTGHPLPDYSITIDMNQLLNERNGLQKQLNDMNSVINDAQALPPIITNLKG